MADDHPTSPGDEPPFGIPFLQDMMKLLSGQGDQSAETARQLAMSVAADGSSEANVEPLVRIRYEELAEVAGMHVAQALDRDGPALRRRPSVRLVTRAEWAAETLAAYGPLFERLASSLSRPPSVGEEDANDPGMAMLAQMMQFVQPMMLSMATGSMVGRMAQRALGAYDLPFPRPDAPLPVCAANIDALAREWDVPIDDLRLYVLVRELATDIILGVPHIRAEVERLVLDHASGFNPDPTALEGALSGLDPMDPSSLAGMQETLGDPELILGAIKSDLQRALQPHLEAVTAVVGGVADHVATSVGTRLLGRIGPLADTMERHRVGVDPSDRMIDRLLGLDDLSAVLDRGFRFAEGVTERAGPEGLLRLFDATDNLPTPAEVDAPGLWLARIDLSA